ncbi:MAG TPA: hypothetical protein VEU62_02925, partial [Bryobacterales bacterium]|nr:hypothetical protein [Bryobacterales bacterium]
MFFRRRKEAPPSFSQQLEAARAQGFTLEDAEAGRVRISKHGCAAVVEHAGGGRVRFVEKPGVLVNGEIAKLVD